MSDHTSLIDGAKAVLDANYRDGYTVPAEGLYPHQWLWDSCFIAIGLRHYDTERAQAEIVRLLSGQWSNGMLPNMIFAEGDRYRLDRGMWRSWLNPFAPDGVATSGITQPPLLAEAVVRIGEKLSKPERHTWYQTVLPALIKYHQWLYTDRDPRGEGLVLQIHPWETGLDNTPPWMYELHNHEFSLAIRIAKYKPMQYIIDLFRRDKKHVSLPGERLTAFEAFALYSVQRRLRRKNYAIDSILSHSHFAIEDIAYNAMFIRANQLLTDIAQEINIDLPSDLAQSISKSPAAFEMLWDAYSGQYFSRNFMTHKLIKVSSIGTLMPLYAGTITKERAAQLVKLLDNTQLYKSDFPIASAPVNSPWFKPHGYWQGPVWLNTNWMIIDGLRRYGYDSLANSIAKKTLSLVEKNGFYEYFSPLDGTPAGASNFSWTAALTLDMASDKNLR